MFDKEEFRDYHKPRVGVFKDIINDVINLVIFDGTFYRRVNLGKKNWVEENIFTDVIGWIWSWMNTINTNYTCIYYIIEFLNELYPNDRITMDKLCDPNTENETLERIKTLMIIHKQEIFTPKKNGSASIRTTSFYQQGKTKAIVKKHGVTQERIDMILDKINQKGYENLTEDEKRILNKASKEGL
jgi:hypothetical protein